MLRMLIIKRILITICVLGMGLGVTSEAGSQSLDETSLVLPKESPVISERFEQLVSEMEPGERAKVWVFFTDKGIFDTEEYRSALNRAREALTQKAAWRRAKTMKPNLVDFRILSILQ